MSTTARETVYLEDGWFHDFGGGIGLAGSRCLACEKTFFPPKTVCPSCYEGELRRVPMSARGTLHTFAVSHMGPADIEKPYIVGFVDLPEGVRIFSRITGCDPVGRGLRTGIPVEMVLGTIQRDRQGRDVVGYLFRPVREEDPG